MSNQKLRHKRPREFIDAVCDYIEATGNKSFLSLFADLCVIRINSGRNLAAAHVRHFCLRLSSIKNIKVYLIIRWSSPLDVFDHIAGTDQAHFDNIVIILGAANDCEQTAILARITQ